jgi:aminoglycoside/choline kinase family phosphotransferase
LTEILCKLFEQCFHAPATQVSPVQGELGGSGRSILRLTNHEHRAIGVIYNVAEENAAFLGFSRHFRRHGLPVPEIYAEDAAQSAYLEEDLGDTTLYQFLSEHRQGSEIAPEAIAAYRRVVEILPRFQVEAGRDLNYKLCYPRAAFDRQSIAWDLNYFKYYFLKLAGVPFHEAALENDFRKLTALLLSAERQYFLYRDFQSRNIMLQPAPASGNAAMPLPAAGAESGNAAMPLPAAGASPWFIDYQGGRRGALQYDIASLLFDSKADLPPALRAQLLEHYLDALGTHIELDRAQFMHHYYAYVYVRLMQALGAYGFRGLYERKSHFLQSVPYALRNLRWLLHNATLPIELPALTEAFTAMVGSEKLMGGLKPEPELLTVAINSFSFHRGPLEDESGHGGGFVFDARSLPNPGREERFKRLNGRDAEVAEYLQARPEVARYFASAMELVRPAVAEYERRGFKHLMISFGCTGGQHRSVYLAEQAAAELRKMEGIAVTLRHREAERWPR